MTQHKPRVFWHSESRIVKRFSGRTFRETVAAAADYQREHNLLEVTSQWGETAFGWSGTVCFREAEPTP